MSRCLLFLCYIATIYGITCNNSEKDLSVVLVQALQGQLQTCMDQNAELIRRTCTSTNDSTYAESSEADKIAFHTGLSKDITDLPNGQILIFDTVYLNEGNSYNPKTGVFTCIRDGIYVFHWTILTKMGKYFYTDFMVNGKLAGRSHPNGATVNRAASSTVVKKMAVGDRAWIQPHSNFVGQYAFGGWSFFSGYKL